VEICVSTLNRYVIKIQSLQIYIIIFDVSLMSMKIFFVEQLKFI